MPALPQDVVNYWRNAGPRRWFHKDARFDEAIRLRFEPVHFAAARGQYDDWAQEAEPALALILLLDQFPRNLFRDSAHAFATDGKARRICDWLAGLTDGMIVRTYKRLNDPDFGSLRDLS